MKSDTLSNHQLDNIRHKSRKQNNCVLDLFVHKNVLIFSKLLTVKDGDLLFMTVCFQYAAIGLISRD